MPALQASSGPSQLELREASVANDGCLDLLIRQNPGLLEAPVKLHQSEQIPPNTYLLDLDAHRANARLLSGEAKRMPGFSPAKQSEIKIQLYFMNK